MALTDHISKTELDKMEARFAAANEEDDALEARETQEGPAGDEELEVITSAGFASQGVTPRALGDTPYDELGEDA